MAKDVDINLDLDALNYAKDYIKDNDDDKAVFYLRCGKKASSLSFVSKGDLSLIAEGISEICTKEMPMRDMLLKIVGIWLGRDSELEEIFNRALSDYKKLKLSE